MLEAVDEYILCDLLATIPSPNPDDTYIPFVRFNSSEHYEIREKGVGPYGSLQFLSHSPDFSRSNQTARICKYISQDRRRVRVDRYPTPVDLEYQLNLYGTRNERGVALGQLAMMRRLQERFYAKIPVDVFGDGVLVDKYVLFVRGDVEYRNNLDQPQQYEVFIPYTAKAWFFSHTSEDRATFWNRAELSVAAVERSQEITSTTVSADTDDLILTP